MLYRFIGSLSFRFQITGSQKKNSNSLLYGTPQTRGRKDVAEGSGDWCWPPSLADKMCVCGGGKALRSKCEVMTLAGSSGSSKGPHSTSLLMIENFPVHTHTHQNFILCNRIQLTSRERPRSLEKDSATPSPSSLCHIKPQKIS